MELDVKNLGMSYIGIGKLVGYDSYTKDNVTKHLYSVLMSEGGGDAGLCKKCSLITIIQDSDTIPEKKAQMVMFNVEVKTFNKEQYSAYSNIRPIKFQGVVVYYS